MSELLIGPHRLRVEGDTVLTRYIGVPELEHVQEIHRHFERVFAEHGRLFIINDMHHTGVPATATRKWISEWARAHPITGHVSFGASLPIRLLQALVMRASALFSKQPLTAAEHVDGEAEAFAWVAARRQQPR
ncbi:MAG TPA: hypothetical protein VGB85_31620 [Nannocystis sp.]|jgi:hypothetical protein